MSTMITEQCINCGACEFECPNYAISRGRGIFVIDPALCTECVGFLKTERCGRVCPLECCVPDPNNIEAEEVLFERAQKIHPDEPLVLSEKTSRFRAVSLWSRVLRELRGPQL